MLDSFWGKGFYAQLSKMSEGDARGSNGGLDYKICGNLLRSVTICQFTKQIYGSARCAVVYSQPVKRLDPTVTLL
jgi:hypothetical protein